MIHELMIMKISPSKSYHHEVKKKIDCLIDWLNVYCFMSHSIFFRHNFVGTSDICSALTVLKHGGIYRAIPAMTRYPILTRTNAPFSRLLQQPGDTEDLSNLFSHVQIVFYLSDSRHPTISLWISKVFLWKNWIFYICN